MSKPTNPKKEQSPRGRPETRVIRTNATPEEIARRICENARPPKPAQRQTRKP